jgi:hypothetical protein
MKNQNIKQIKLAKEKKKDKHKFFFYQNRSNVEKSRTRRTLKVNLAT